MAEWTNGGLFPNRYLVRRAKAGKAQHGHGLRNDNRDCRAFSGALPAILHVRHGLLQSHDWPTSIANSAAARDRATARAASIGMFVISRFDRQIFAQMHAVLSAFMAAVSLSRMMTHLPSSHIGSGSSF